MKELELIPDAVNLIESTRSIGYSLPAAVADIIDNSIAAGADSVWINSPIPENQRMTILDNGHGMNRDALEAAMRYGSKFSGDQRGEQDLGRFGLGLKMASLSQCRSLTVITKEENGPVLGARWDLDYIANVSKKWTLQLLNKKEIEKYEEAAELEENGKGTLVCWENLDFMLQDLKKGIEDPTFLTRMAEVKSYLSLVFHRYLSGAETDISAVQIYFNNGLLDRTDPFLMKKSTMPMAEDHYEFKGHRICIQPYILPHQNRINTEDKTVLGLTQNLQNNQGFYLYRNKRLIFWGNWLGLQRKEENAKLARVRVDIPASVELDRIWRLDVKKTKAVIPDELRRTIAKTISGLVDRSRKVFTVRARKEVSKDNLHLLWQRESLRENDNAVRYTLNMAHPVIKNCLEKYPDLKPVFKMMSVLPLNAIYTDFAMNKSVESGPSDSLDIFMDDLFAFEMDEEIKAKWRDVIREMKGE